MTHDPQSLPDHLLKLLQQVDQDRAALRPGMVDGKAVYSRLFDSRTATLHNLQHSSAGEKRVD